MDGYVEIAMDTKNVCGILSEVYTLTAPKEIVTEL